MQDRQGLPHNHWISGAHREFDPRGRIDIILLDLAPRTDLESGPGHNLRVDPGDMALLLGDDDFPIAGRGEPVGIRANIRIAPLEIDHP